MASSEIISIPWHGRLVGPNLDKTGALPCPVFNNVLVNVD